MKQSSSIRAAIPLRNRVTCPHCWNVFPPEQALWIAQHPDLIGDPRLGDQQQQRFLPTRFTVDGAAIDSRGFACHGLACPRCHLAVPRPLFETEPLFLSILGAPACGKSYFLASMTWQLRKVLPKNFSLAFGDADPVSNDRLHGYEGIAISQSRSRCFGCDRKNGNARRLVRYRAIRRSRLSVIRVRSIYCSAPR